MDLLNGVDVEKNNRRSFDCAGRKKRDLLRSG